jgi:phosphoribosylformylglycinamidine synthase subunit PurQ / glutaminase
MAKKPRAVVVVFPGSNGDRDLYETLERAGFAVRYQSSDEIVRDAELVGLPGGFSYGDYWRAGMLASQAKAVQSIRDVVDKGGLAIGICNGFQILVEGGLLPGALSYNDPPGFRHRWLTVEKQPAMQSPWFAEMNDGEQLRLPMAHGEGNYYHPGGAGALEGHVPLVYTRNPNGSLGDTAALLDATGRILGIMPHPERASDPDLGSADGMKLFRSAFAALGAA